MTDSELKFISDAKTFLENPSLIIRLANKVGQPLEKGLRLLPQKAQDKIQTAVKVSLERGVQVVTQTVPAAPSASHTSSTESALDQASEASQKKAKLHSVAAFATGALGGFFGVMSLPVELPLSTAIMLRSIVMTANEFGFDTRDPEVQLECLYVLSLGSPESTSDDALRSAYWTSRVAFMDLIRNASKEIGRSSAPFLVKFLARVATRFETVVSEKVLAEAMPIVGALGGGMINTAFSNHFNDCARYHFGLRALEKKYGEADVQAVYQG